MITEFDELVDIGKYPYKHSKAVITIFGDKGTGKTIDAYAFPGNILSLGYEREHNQTLPHEKFYSSTKRIQIKNFDKFLNSEEGETKKETYNLVFEATLKILLNASKLDFDWIHFDGLQELPSIAEMRMRLSNSFGAYEGFKDFIKWNERTDFLDQMFRTALRVAKRGVIFTSQNVIQEALFGPDKGKQKEPAWKGRIKKDTTTVIYTRKEEAQRVDGSKISQFFAYVDSCKLSGYSGEIETTLTKDNNPKKLVEKILNSKPELTIE